MPIVEIFISAFVTVLFEKLSSGNFLSFARRKGVLKEIEKWSLMLENINYVLSDAEDQQGNNPATKIWLGKLQDLAYDLDDILDEFATEQIKLELDELNSIQPRSIKSKLKAIISGCCTNSTSFSPRGFMFNSNMMSEINDISSRLEFITKQMRDLKLNNTVRTSTNKTTTSQGTPTVSLIHEPKICGRGKNIEEIREFLLGHCESSQGNDNLGVIPIVGMGGIGKTTLAQAVYNDEIVEEHFTTKAWVCVSDDFDVMRIAKTILESVALGKCDSNDLNQVVNKLKNNLVGKKILIVLDDVWQKNQNDSGSLDHQWSVLKASFCDAARGSKVIVTTRDENVASLMGSSKHHHHILQHLPFDDCWSLFVQHAFENRNVGENANLVEIGKKIVEKCKGLPLSARVLGGLLKCKESEVEWKVVLDSEWWEDSQILPSLRLSYHHLPPSLKPCFAYCSIFPKDYAFGKEELVLLWIAEGLVHKSRENRQLENIGRDYFHELFSRSLFQLSSSDGTTELFLMHDMINDLAGQISGDLCYRLEDKPLDEERSRNLGRARYSSFLQGKFDDVKKFERFFEAKSLRTFLPFSLISRDCYLASIVPSTLFPKLRYLRSLSLRNYKNIDLPKSVGDMKHLRYLDLSHTIIETLPDWVLNLYNLQTLILRGCNSLEYLPKNMGNLIKLRYFDLTDANRLKEMPLGIGYMKNLHMLSNFIVTKDNGSRIRDLRELRHIGETLCISGLRHVIDPMDAKGAYLIEKEHLTKLIMLYGSKSDEMLNEEVQVEVLREMKPHYNLKELHITKYRGTSFPTWLEDPLFTNMVHIEIENCSNCSVLPSLGELKSLKYLYIQGLNSIRHVGREFYGPLSQKPFSSLETLSFDNLPEWEDWLVFGADDEVKPFGQLKNFMIKNCPNLSGKLPTNLPSLEVLNITKCEKLVAKLDRLVYPSLTSLYVNGVELPFISPMISYAKNTHESSPLFTKSISISNSLFNMNRSFRYLNSVEIIGVPKLVCLPEWLTHVLASIKFLKINSCKELETLMENSNNEVMQLEQFPVLQELEILKCQELVSLFSTETDEESGSQRESRAVQSFMKSLKRLYIEDCNKLEKLPQELNMLTCLVELSIHDCPKLVSFPKTGFPPTLGVLFLWNCEALESPLPRWNSDHNLETLYVFACRSLTRLVSSSGSSNNKSIRTDGLPSSLKTISIISCLKLEAVFAGEEENRIHCPSLEYFTCDGCSRIKYLPDTCSDDSLRKLKELNLEGCRDLQYLPDGWIRAIINLSHVGLGRETILSTYILKETGFLTNLHTLYLIKITVDVHPSEWCLHRMSSLRELIIAGPIHFAREGEEVKVCVFPLDGMLLPTSLTILRIRVFPDLERLISKGFQSSLQKLYLRDCPTLAYFPEGGFPDTLMRLDIVNCPLLKRKCEKVKGEFSSILSRIPCVEIKESIEDVF